jgi:predicted lipoprotein
LATAFVLSCSKNKNDIPGEDPDKDLTTARKEVAAQVANHHILPAYDLLAKASNNLNVQVQTFKGEISIENLVKLQSAVKELWLVWQDAAIYQMGPTENNTLRAAINLYPVNIAKIEENINTGSYIIGSIGNQGAEGLPAIDYLLNASPNDDVIQVFNEDISRLSYLETLIVKLDELINVVELQWREGMFLTEFKSDQATGTDVGSAVGILVNAMDLHFQRFVRDGKVAIPAGVRSAGIPRPMATEALYGGYSGELLERALVAYQSLFEGEGIDGINGISIYGYLSKIDQAALVDDVRVLFVTAIQQTRQLDNSFSDQIMTDEKPMVELFLTLQGNVALMKSDMASVMGIAITNQDNDGD